MAWVNGQWQPNQSDMTPNFMGAFGPNPMEDWLKHAIGEQLPAGKPSWSGSGDLTQAGSGTELAGYFGLPSSTGKYFNISQLADLKQMSKGSYWEPYRRTLLQNYLTPALAEQRNALGSIAGSGFASSGFGQNMYESGRENLAGQGWRAYQGAQEKVGQQKGLLADWVQQMYNTAFGIKQGRNA